jgi:hypothetical protein
MHTWLGPQVYGKILVEGGSGALSEQKPLLQTEMDAEGGAAWAAGMWQVSARMQHHWHMALHISKQEIGARLSTPLPHVI